MIHDLRAALSVGILTIIWGSSFFLTTQALTGFHPLSVAFLRIALAGVVLLPIAHWTGAGLPRGAEWKTAALLGIVGMALPQSLLAFSQQTLPSATVSIFISAVPLFVLLLAWGWLGETIGARRWLGFCVGFCGLILLAGPDAMRGLGTESGVTPVLMALGAAVFYALSAVAIRKLPGMHPLRATSGAMVVGSIVAAPFGLGYLPNTIPPAGAIYGILALGLFPTGIAQLLRYYTVQRSGPVYASVVGYLIPIWAGFLGVAVLGEVLGLRQIAAYGLILLGISVARDRLRRSAAGGFTPPDPRGIFKNKR